MLTLPSLQPLSHQRATLLIPASQIPRFHEETSEARKYVLDWISILEPLRHVKGRTALFKDIALSLDEKPGNIKSRYYAWCDGCDGKFDTVWEGLINRSRFPKPGDRALPELFLDHWRGLREDQKRLNDGGRQAHRDLLTALSLWETKPHDASLRIPGYTTVPARTKFCSQSKQRVPDGWSYRNLIRHKPRRVQLVNVILGPKAASSLLPGNIATRAGLKYREIVFSDDQDYDTSVVTGLNRGEAMRPQGFNTLDYLTGCFESYGIQLRRRDEETGRKRGLDQEAYVWTILTDLIENGFRDDERGTRIIREHATAKGFMKKDGYGDSFDDLIHHITEGRVTFDASGRFDHSMFAQALCSGRGKQSSGNFRFKAPLESAFHRVRTQMAGFLGDTGNRYQVQPEQTEAIDRYESKLFTAIEKLPAAERALVYDLARHLKHTWTEFTTLMTLVYGAVNARRDHTLEGWAASGFIVPVYALPDPIDRAAAPRIITREDFAAMEPEQRQYIQTFARDEQLVLSPTEARDMCRARDRKIVRLGKARAVAALPVSWAYPKRKGKDGGVKVRQDGTLLIRDPERFGPESLVYLGVLHRDDAGRTVREHLHPGQEFLLHVCPFAPAEALVLTMDGRYCGTVKLMSRPTANDIAARLRNQGAINEYAADLRRDSERRQAGRLGEMADIIEHNDRLLTREIRPDDETLTAAAYVHECNEADAAEDAGLVVIRPEDITESHHRPVAPPTTASVNIFANIPELDGEDRNSSL